MTAEPLTPGGRAHGRIPVMDPRPPPPDDWTDITAYVQDSQVTPGRPAPPYPKPSSVKRPPRRGIPDWVWILGAGAVGVLVAGVALANGAADDAVEDAANATEEPLTFSADGDSSTDPITLAGGAYSVRYRFDGGCYYGADLVPIDPGFFEFSEDLATGDGPIDGDSNVYDVPAGDYYVRVTTGPAPGCPWSITLTPA